jgi:signal recognition particle GTPase
MDGLNNELSLARQAARERYLKNQERENERQRQEQEERDREHREWERRAQEEQEERDREERNQHRRSELLSSWDELVSVYSIGLEELTQLNELLDTIDVPGDMLYDRVVQLIERLNQQQIDRQTSPYEARQLATVMRQILDKTGTDVEIDIMDTTEDVQYAQQLEEDEIQTYIQEIENGYYRKPSPRGNGMFQPARAASP